MTSCFASGFVDNAEKINSRAAMIGFFGVIIVEAVRCTRPAPALRAQGCAPLRPSVLLTRLAAQLAGKGLLELIGIETGNGIDIGF